MEFAYRISRYLNEGPFIFLDCDYYNLNGPLLTYEGFKLLIKTDNEIILTITGKIDRELLISGLSKMVDNLIVI